VVLGPSLLAPYDGLTSLGPELTAIQVLGTAFIVFMAGMYVAPGTLVRLDASALVLGLGVFVVPFSITTVVARVLMPDAGGLLPLFLGLTISITALPVMGVMLAEFGLLREPIGTLLMNAALVNEMVAVSVFAVLLRLTDGGSNLNGDLSAVGLATLSVAVFLGAIFGLSLLMRSLERTGWWESSLRRAARGLRSREAGLGLVMFCVIVGSLFSQFLGLTYILGAFYAGILVSQGFSGLEARWNVHRVFDALSWGFFLPLFFAFVGVEMDLRRLANPTTILVFLVLAGTAVVTKVVTGYSIARIFRWNPSRSLAIGHMVSSRGAVELAMAVVLLSDGIFSTQVFTIVAAVGLVTTIIAPIGAARALREDRQVPSAPPGSGPGSPGRTAGSST